MIHTEDRLDSLGPAIITRDVDHEQHGDPGIVMPMTVDRQLINVWTKL
jgi:hypothetical protein